MIHGLPVARLLLGAMVLCCGGVLSAAEDVFLEPTRIRPVQLTIAAADYEAMQPKERKFNWFGLRPEKNTDPALPVREVHRNNFGVDLAWVKGAATFNGQAFEDIGVRYKGNGTILDSMHTAKKSFKLDLDRHGGDARFQGRKTINLHAGAADPSRCRETLGYGLYRAAGVPTPRTTLAEVRLNVPGKHDNELLGIYTVVEEVDKAFLAAHFGADQGLLMKPENLRDIEYLGDDWSEYEPRYRPERTATPEEAARVIAFARFVQTADDAAFAAGIAAFLDVEAYMRFLAVTAFVANSDSFFVLGHNYYMYLHPPTGQFHFIPWDLDRALGNFPFLVLGTNSEQMDLSLTHPYAGEHRLTERLLAMPEVSAKYQALLAELAATCFDKARILAELAALQATVEDLRTREKAAAVARQEGKPRNPSGAPANLEKFFERRTASVAAQLAGTSQGFVPKGGFPFFQPPPKKATEVK